MDYDQSIGRTTKEDNHSRQKEASTTSESEYNRLVVNPSLSPGFSTTTSRNANKTNLETSRPDGYKRIKVCKRGYREATSPKVCGILFEGCPVWCWAIRITDWSKIVITGPDEARIRQFYVSTWSFLKERLEIVRTKEVSTLAGVDMWFAASGSM